VSQWRLMVVVATLLFSRCAPLTLILHHIGSIDIIWPINLF
jgi:hypothetical protein